ncbi:MAG TPA: hypothetical protein VG276_28150 [Actinomycetes bacterium]|jgi:hypothetical protein|nr:hypothetical protein [Actinomycetes bacterium]
MADVEVHTLVSEVLVDGDPMVKITHTPDGRACPWRVTATPPAGLGAPADRDLFALFDTEPAAVQAAQALAQRLHTARELLRQANQQLREARAGLKEAEHG